MNRILLSLLLALIVAGQAVSLDAMKRGPDRNDDNGASKRPAVKDSSLHIAAQNGNLIAVQAILNTPGISICTLLTAKNSKGQTALDVAQKAGHQNIVDFLLVALLQGLLIQNQNQNNS